MVKKCLIPGCNPNYRSRKGCRATEQKTPVFRFPRDKSEYSGWMKAIPYTNITTRQDSVICEKHWPESYPTVSIKRRTSPKDPPSVWPGVPSSCVPRPTPAPRSTKKSSMEVRNSKPDEMDCFREMDKVSYNDIVDREVIKNHNFRCPVVVQSVNFSESAPIFFIVINESLEFKTFHMGRRVSIYCIVKNNIRFLNSWSGIEVRGNCDVLIFVRNKS